MGMNGDEWGNSPRHRHLEKVRKKIKRKMKERKKGL
jgi:hypothetical protein